MLFKKYIPLALIGLMAMAGCKKELSSQDTGPKKTSTGQFSKTGPGLYVAGNILTTNGVSVAAYWKDGTPVRLVTDTTIASYANAIAVSDTNVYIAGSVTGLGGAQSTAAAYWKNGVVTKLPGGISASAITVNGADVCVAGYSILGNTSVATYWKNGTQVTLTTEFNTSFANAITVSGTDVYVAGYTNPININVATYWKNGTPVSLTDDSPDATEYSYGVNAIAVNGTDIYVAGANYTNHGTIIAAAWKNGSESDLTNGASDAFSSRATAIAVNGNDVYVTGASNGAAIYWKNGVAVPLTNGSIDTKTTAILLNGSDMYITGGATGADGNSVPIAAYWKNGSMVQLAKNASANGIAIVK
jgi:hypothetical protein